MSTSNPTIELLCGHRSIRAYTDQPLSNEQIEAIIKAAQAVSSSNFLQTATIIRITDRALRQKLAKLSGDQHYIVEAAEFWVFCADFNRNKQINKNLRISHLEDLLVGTIDTALMAQNAVVAAESLGLGCVYIGGIRNHIEKVSEELAVPKYVVPLFGLCIGYPAQNPAVKPRLPKGLICFNNRYQPVDRQLLSDYDRTIASYYSERTGKQQEINWYHVIANVTNNDRGDSMLAYLKKQGWIDKQ